jgi:hypothetical protein
MPEPDPLAARAQAITQSLSLDAPLQPAASPGLDRLHVPRCADPASIEQSSDPRIPHSLTASSVELLPGHQEVDAPDKPSGANTELIALIGRLAIEDSDRVRADPRSWPTKLRHWTGQDVPNQRPVVHRRSRTQLGRLIHESRYQDARWRA